MELFFAFDDGYPNLLCYNGGTIDLTLYVLDDLFDSFGEESTSDDDDVQNFDDADEPR